MVKNRDLRARRAATVLAVLAPLAATAWVTPAAADPPALLVALQQEACRRLVAHVPAPDVAYRPGVDGRGNPVVPADLEPPETPPWLDPLVIPLTLDLSAVADLPPGIGADIPLMQVTVDPLGRVRLDGRPVEDRTAALLAAACRAR